MLEDYTPAVLVGPEDVATVLGVPPGDVRALLEARNDPPVATYRGKPLWLADTAHDGIPA